MLYAHYNLFNTDRPDTLTGKTKLTVQNTLFVGLISIQNNQQAYRTYF